MPLSPSAWDPGCGLSYRDWLLAKGAQTNMGRSRPRRREQVVGGRVERTVVERTDSGAITTVRSHGERQDVHVDVPAITGRGGR